MIECYCIEQWNSKKFLDSLQKIMGKSFTLIDYICLAHSEKRNEKDNIFLFKVHKLQFDLKDRNTFLQYCLLSSSKISDMMFRTCQTSLKAGI